MQRRQLLKLGVVSGAALAIVGSASLFYQKPELRDETLTGAAHAVLYAVSSGLLEGSMPTEAGALSASMAAYRDRLAATVLGLPRASQRELAQLLSLLARAPGRWLLSGLATDWPQATREEIRDALETMRASRIKPRRQIYHALRDLARAAWYADPTTWAALGYPGPQAVA